MGGYEDKKISLRFPCSPDYLCAMDFSVVIPTFNNLGELQGCLAALDATAGCNFEVHVCVDGSTDGTSEWLSTAAFSFPLLVHHHPGRVNKGRAATRNLSLDHLRGRHTLFLDSDMEAAPDLFQQHAHILDQGDTVSIGAVRYRNRKGNLWVRYTSERGVAKFQPGAEVPFQYFITPNTAMPTQWLREVGGFDPLINRYGGEDMELGYRIHTAFTPHFIYNEAARVTTTQPKTLREALPQLREYGGSGLPYIVRKWPELDSTYWVKTCSPNSLKDRLFNLMALPLWRPMAFAFLRLTPFSIQKLLINYLVISHVHEGYRAAMRQSENQ